MYRTLERSTYKSMSAKNNQSRGPFGWVTAAGWVKAPIIYLLPLQLRHTGNEESEGEIRGTEVKTNCSLIIG